MKPSNRNFQKGVTLIEVVTTMAIAIVLATVATAPFGQMLGAMRMRSATSDIVNDLIFARSEALKRGQLVAITPSSDSWNSGWRITAVASNEVLGTRNPLGGGVNFSSSPAAVTFDSSGRLSGATSVVRFGLSSGGNNSRCVSLDPSGRPKSTKAACPT